MIRELGMLNRLPFVPAACVWETQCDVKSACQLPQPCRALCASQGARLKGQTRRALRSARTSRRVAVLAHCPKAMVAMSGLMTSMVSRMEMMEYAWPPARRSHW